MLAYLQGLLRDAITRNEAAAKIFCNVQDLKQFWSTTKNEQQQLNKYFNYP
jgi:hypothetical protein